MYCVYMYACPSVCGGILRVLYEKQVLQKMCVLLEGSGNTVSCAVVHMGTHPWGRAFGQIDIFIHRFRPKAPTSVYIHNNYC